MGAFGQRSAGAELEDSGRAGGKEFDDSGERDFFFGVKFGNGQGQRGFQAGDAEAGALELDLLFVGSVGGVVGGDGVDGAVGERNQNRFAVGGGAQRRVHLEVGVVFADVFIDQSEVVRRDFAGDAGVGALAAAHGLERVGSGKMRDVQARFVNLLGERDVALDD